MTRIIWEGYRRRGHCLAPLSTTGSVLVSKNFGKRKVCQPFFLCCDCIADSVSTGIRVAHVRAIFKLPEHYRIDTLHPLVYLEWFTPFHAVDHATGLFTVSRSTRMHQVYGEVVEADRLVRNCHLAPKYPRTKDPSWTSETVTELCNTYYHNSFIDMHMYCLFVLQRDRCLPTINWSLCTHCPLNSTYMFLSTGKTASECGLRAVALNERCDWLRTRGRPLWSGRAGEQRSQISLATMGYIALVASEILHRAM